MILFDNKMWIIYIRMSDSNISVNFVKEKGNIYLNSIDENGNTIEYTNNKIPLLNIGQNGIYTKVEDVDLNQIITQTGQEPNMIPISNNVINIQEGNDDSNDDADDDDYMKAEEAEAEEAEAEKGGLDPQSLTDDEAKPLVETHIEMINYEQKKNKNK